VATLLLRPSFYYKDKPKLTTLSYQNNLQKPRKIVSENSYCGFNIRETISYYIKLSINQFSNRDKIQSTINLIIPKYLQFNNNSV